MNQNANPLQPVNPQQVPVPSVQPQVNIAQPVTQPQVVVQTLDAMPTQPVKAAVLQPAQHTILPHRIPEMPVLEEHVTAGPHVRTMKKDRSFYAAVIVFVCLIVALSGYIFLALSNPIAKPTNTNTAVNNPVTNVPVSDSTDVPKFVEKAFELNKKVIWRATYPETLFADETKIDSGKVTLTGEYLDEDIKVIMSFPTFKDYPAGIPFYFSDWLKAEKAFADPAVEESIRTELTTVQGLEAATVYGYPEIIEDTPKRILGTKNSIVVYIWKNSNNNPRRIEFKMDDYNETFLSNFAEDFIQELEFQ